MTDKPVVIRYGDQPVVPGPLHQFNRIRHRILADTIRDTQQEIDREDLEMLLAEALYLEKRRMGRKKKFSLEYLMTVRRNVGDERLWSWVRGQLLKKPSDADRKQVLRQVLRHYSDEIGAHFSLRTYAFARRVSPWMFSWLLNAASVKRFVPWGMTESLQDRLRITGEIEATQELAKRGTILLVPTHQSNIDSVLIGYVIYLMSLPPFSYGAGLNLLSNPVLSFFMSNLGAYTVDRQKTSRLYKATLKNYSTRILQEGIHSVFFPGGGRSRSGAVESKLKLGLLGTGLSAEIQNLRMQKAFPRVFIVPMVTSYHFVLEAGSLIEQYLQDAGQHLFLRNSHEETPPFLKLMKFFWKFFSIQSNITVNFGQALDVFGNPVDRDGHSQGPNGTIIDPRTWLTTGGELREEPQRDAEYTRQLGNRLVDSYYENNVVLDSHLVAFALFSAIRKRYRDLDIFRFVRLTQAQRTVPYAEFLEVVESVLKSVKDLARQSKLKLSPELQTADVEAIVKGAVQQLGVMHEAKVVRIAEGMVWTDDVNLLYYYRNRLSGYGLSLMARRHGAQIPRGDSDEKGFLA